MRFSVLLLLRQLRFFLVGHAHDFEIVWRVGRTLGLRQDFIEPVGAAVVFLIQVLKLLVDRRASGGGESTLAVVSRGASVIVERFTLLLRLTFLKDHYTRPIWHLTGIRIERQALLEFG